MFSKFINAHIVLLIVFSQCDAFQSLPSFSSRRCQTTRLHSSVGDGNGSGDGKDDEGQWDDFLNPSDESDNMREAREYMSENSLPISFDAQDKGADHTDDASTNDTDDSDISSALVGLTGRPGELIPGSPSEELVSRNPYMAVVSKLSPSELISKFTSTAHPSVQNAVRTTILGLIGGLPKMAFDTTTITTGQRLASLMFQLQMTGYMFKNAEYKLSMQQALIGVDDEKLAGKLLLEGTDEPIDPLKGKIRGKLRVHYGRKDKKSDDDSKKEEAKKDDAGDIEVDAAAYMSELRSEVSKLRDELMITRREKQEALRKDLLMYIRTLPEKELQSLTNTMSQDVLVAMKGLVNAVMSGIGEGQIGPDTVTEQSGEAMAQLCMWQLAIGYNLRTLEVREEMKQSLLKGASTDDAGGVDLTEPGALE